MLVDRFHSKAELILAICVASCSVLNAIVPYSKWIELLFVLFLVEGWIEVIVNVGKSGLNIKGEPQLKTVLF